jgi:hypothetical protein
MLSYHINLQKRSYSRDLKDSLAVGESSAKILPCFYAEIYLLFIALFSTFHSKYLNQSLLRDVNNYTS